MCKYKTIYSRQFLKIFNIYKFLCYIKQKSSKTVFSLHRREWRNFWQAHTQAHDLQLLAQRVLGEARRGPGVLTHRQDVLDLLLFWGDSSQGCLGVFFDCVLHYLRVGMVALDHISQELHAEDDMTRFVACHSSKAAPEAWEQVIQPIVFQDAALARYSHSSLDNHMIERDSLDQRREIFGSMAQALADLAERFDQDIFQARIHILAHFGQGILQLTFIQTNYLVKETSEEDGVAGLIHLLRGQEQAHLFFRHRHNIGTQCIGNAGLALKESRETIKAHHMLVLRHGLPLLPIK